jgi:hypothetical protein
LGRSVSGRAHAERARAVAAMRATTIQQVESAPTTYPNAPDNLSVAAKALDPAMIWQRIETYVAWRWTPRDVMWIVTGRGEWHAPLAPATIATNELWDGAAWGIATPDPSPLGGFLLPGHGPYKFTGTVGAGDVPAAVNEAFRRLAEYMAKPTGTAGASTERITVPGVLTTEVVRSQSWMASALQNSGAADLLRQYRKV